MKKKKIEAEKKEKKPSNPDMGTYNPLPVTFETFSHTFIVQAKKKGNELKTKHFGTCDRFFDPKNYKRKLNVPGPGNYDMIA